MMLKILMPESFSGLSAEGKSVSDTRLMPTTKNERKIKNGTFTNQERFSREFTY
ncbi:MAG: hypothetical protein IJ681_00070 [Bacteroidales bacterium]|nr:hypothetical protein [Bacteroidales bacterium]